MVLIQMFIRVSQRVEVDAIVIGEVIVHEKADPAVGLFELEVGGYVRHIALSGVLEESTRVYQGDIVVGEVVQFADLVIFYLDMYAGPLGGEVVFLGRAQPGRGYSIVEGAVGPDGVGGGAGVRVQDDVEAAAGLEEVVHHASGAIGRPQVLAVRMDGLN